MTEGDDNTAHTHNDDESTYGEGSLVTMDENDSIDGRGYEKDSKAASFMRVLSACHSPLDVSSRKLEENLSDNTDNRDKEGSSKELNAAADKVSSLFQQVLNCGLNNAVESDDESYNHRGTFDTYDDGDTYGSLTEDDTVNVRARRRGRRKRY